jgi:hypothetical protein
MPQANAANLDRKPVLFVLRSSTLKAQQATTIESMHTAAG